MYPPFFPKQLLALIFILVMAIIVMYLGVFTLALEKLGLSPDSAMLLLVCMLMGSGINLPLFSMDSKASVPEVTQMLRGYYFGKPLPFHGKTLIAINVGGAIIPVCFSLYLLLVNPLPLTQVAFAVGVVSVVCYIGSRPIAGIGIGMPIFLAPITAALTALLTAPGYSSPLAYVCGTFGVLIGADLMRMNAIHRIGTPVASIGGAGTFDGIFLTGIIAVLLT